MAALEDVWRICQPSLTAQETPLDRGEQSSSRRLRESALGGKARKVAASGRLLSGLAKDGQVRRG